MLGLWLGSLPTEYPHTLQPINNAIVMFIWFKLMIVLIENKHMLAETFMTAGRNATLYNAQKKCLARTSQALTTVLM